MLYICQVNKDKQNLQTMKTQQFYHLTFTFENFNYGFGRNVLEMILRDKFFIIMEIQLKGKDLADRFKEQYPHIKSISLFSLKDTDIKDFKKNPNKKGDIINLDYYTILRCN